MLHSVTSFLITKERAIVYKCVKRNAVHWLIFVITLHILLVSWVFIFVCHIFSVLVSFSSKMQINFFSIMCSGYHLCVFCEENVCFKHTNFYTSIIFFSFQYKWETIAIVLLLCKSPYSAPWVRGKWLFWRGLSDITQATAENDWLKSQMILNLKKKLLPKYGF